MRWNIKTSANQGFVAAVCHGVVEIDGMREAHCALRQVDGYADGLNVLWDFREADLSAFSIEDMRQLLAFLEQAPRRADRRVAFLVTGQAELMLLKLWRAISSDRFGWVATRTFTVYDDALVWLGVST